MGPGMLSAKSRICDSCAFSASRTRMSSSMSFITTNAPPMRPPTSRSGNSVMRVHRASPSIWRSRRSYDTVAPENARSMYPASSESASVGSTSLSACPSTSSDGTPIRLPNGLFAKRILSCRST